MFKRILVPVDLSEKSTGAVRVAGELAAANHGEVLLLHVIEPIPHTEMRELRSFYSKLERRAKTRFRLLTARKLPAGVSMQTEVVYGKRARAIAEFARKRRADLIVLSSHRVRPGSGFPSVSYEVAVLASCPVLLIK